MVKQPSRPTGQGSKRACGNFWALLARYRYYTRSAERTYHGLWRAGRADASERASQSQLDTAAKQKTKKKNVFSPFFFYFQKLDYFFIFRLSNSR